MSASKNCNRYLIRGLSILSKRERLLPFFSSSWTSCLSQSASASSSLLTWGSNSESIWDIRTWSADPAVVYFSRPAFLRCNPSDVPPFPASSSSDKDEKGWAERRAVSLMFSNLDIKDRSWRLVRPLWRRILRRCWLGIMWPGDFVSVRGVEADASNKITCLVRALRLRPDFRREFKPTGFLGILALINRHRIGGKTDMNVVVSIFFMIYICMS